MISSTSFNGGMPRVNDRELLMTENENSPENLRKFLESDDPALVMMGLSMAKGANLGETPIIAGIALWHEDTKIRTYAKKVFQKLAPEEYNIVKDNWETKYNKIKTWDSIVNHVEVLFDKLKATRLNSPHFWKFALNRSQPGGSPDYIRYAHNIIDELEYLDFATNKIVSKFPSQLDFKHETWHLAIISILVHFNNEEAARIISDSIDFYNEKKYWNRTDGKYKIISNEKFYEGLLFIGKPAVPLLLKKMENNDFKEDISAHIKEELEELGYEL